MNTVHKLFLLRFIGVLIVFIISFIFFVSEVGAQVVINEFASHETSGDWIELYAYEDTDISGWVVRDSATSIAATIANGIIIGPSGNSYYIVNVGDRLNRDGDIIKLLKDDDSTLVDQITYGDHGGVCAPESGQSAGRYPDANSVVERFASMTKGFSNNSATLAPCPTPTLEPTATYTPTPTAQSSATLKIKEVKDEDGNVLSSVKIYIDSTYSHHYAPEDFKFCGDCKCSGCDSEIDLKFGSYAIKLEKDGYEDWEETKDMQSGNTVEINAVMKQKATSNSTPTPTKKQTAIPTKKEDVKASDATKTSEINGSGANNNGDENLVLGINEDIGVDGAGERAGISGKSGKIPFTAGVFMVGGLALVLSATYPILKTKFLKGGQDDGKENNIN